MQIGTVVGHAVSTVKHASMTGWRLLVVQPLGTASKPDGEPVLAVDNQGARPGSRVLISSDGKGARKLLGSPNSPVRWFVMGLIDE
jgi:ethanolamine utilization protein EutN